MPSDKDGVPGGTDFAHYSGDLELDLDHVPRPTPPPDPSAVGRGAPDSDDAPSVQPLSDHDRRGGSRSSGKPAPQLPRRYRDASTGSPSGGLILPVLALLFLTVGSALGYRIFCGYKARDKQHAFSQLIQDLRPALAEHDSAVTEQQVRDVVQRFADAAGVEPVTIHATIEPLTSTSLTRLPRAARIAIGFASQVPNHRLPYSVVGFEATLIARHGWAEKRFTAQRYTWIDQRGPNAPSAGSAASIGRAFEKQIEDKLKRALGGEAVDQPPQRD